MAGKKKGKGKTAQQKKALPAPLGEKILWINYSSEVVRCAGSGLPLPAKGMVVRYEGQMFLDRKYIRS